MTTTVSTILDRKGRGAVTIDPGRSLQDAVAVLTDRNVGALVVSADGASVDGILSERDVVRRLAHEGTSCLELTVGEAMTSPVTTCGLDATATEVMTTMTNSRFRHLPVVDEERLVGIVSIGDVVKSRIVDLETRAESLEQYVTGSSY